MVKLVFAKFCVGLGHGVGGGPQAWGQDRTDLQSVGCRQTAHGPGDKEGRKIDSRQHKSDPECERSNVRSPKYDWSGIKLVTKSWLHSRQLVLECQAHTEQPTEQPMLWHLEAMKAGPQLTWYQKRMWRMWRTVHPDVPKPEPCHNWHQRNPANENDRNHQRGGHSRDRLIILAPYTDTETFATSFFRDEVVMVGHSKFTVIKPPQWQWSHQTSGSTVEMASVEHLCLVEKLNKRTWHSLPTVWGGQRKNTSWRQGSSQHWALTKSVMSMKYYWPSHTNCCQQKKHIIEWVRCSSRKAACWTGWSTPWLMLTTNSQHWRRTCRQARSTWPTWPGRWQIGRRRIRTWWCPSARTLAIWRVAWATFLGMFMNTPQSQSPGWS